MNVDEALDVADDLENHDSADYPKACAALAAEVKQLRKDVNVLDVNWQGEQIARAEFEDELQRQADELERLRLQRQTVLALAHRANLDGTPVAVSHLLQAVEEGGDRG